jgi:hypothetical protein
MAEYTGFRADLWRRIGELISSAYLNSLDDIKGMDDEGLTLMHGRKYSWVSMRATDDEVHIILRRWRAYQRARVGGVWRDGSDERADRLVAEMEREGQPWTVRTLREAFVPAYEVRASFTTPPSTFMDTLTKVLTVDDIKYTGAVPATPVASVPPAPVSRWALLEPEETADPEAVVQAWREAEARRKAKPHVPAYHETILDLTECNLIDAVLRCTDMWDELDRADRRKRMN